MATDIPLPAGISAPRLDRRGWMLLLILSVLWSGSFIFMKVASADLPILTLALIRVGLAAAVLHGVVLISGRRYPTSPALLARYGAMALLNNVVPGALIIFATTRIGAGAASILNATVPIFSLIIAHATTSNDRITAHRLAGIVLGILGVAAMAGPQALAGVGGDLPAVLAMLVATFSYGLANSVGRRFSDVDPIVSATCQLTAATLIFAPLTLAIDRPWTLAMPGTPALLCAAGLALASTALAYVLFFNLLARAGATNTSLVTLLIPVGGVGFAWVFLGEPLTAAKAAGMILIISGLVVIDSRLWLSLATPLGLTARG